MILERLIDVFKPAEGAPPRRLWPFFRWSIRGGETALLLLAVFSLLGGIFDVAAAYILGLVIDLATGAEQNAFWQDHKYLLMLCAAFFLVFRPVIFGLFSAFQSISVGPNLLPMVHARLFRWTLGQQMQYFEEDFAGRLSQKQQQTATAITDVVIEICHTVLFAMASIGATLVLLLSIEPRLVPILAVWMVGYVVMFRYFRQRIRIRSRARAEAKAVVSGQVVDAITNIKTVKLFAHNHYEDQATISALGKFRQKALDFGYLNTYFRIWLHSLASILPVGMVGGALYFWSQGSVSLGEVTAAGTVSIRLSQMANWISFSMMTLFTNLGVAEDGMRTLTAQPKLVDAPDAKPLRDVRGQIDFENVHFRYGRDIGGVDGINFRLSPGEKLGLVGASGAGKSTIVSLLLRLYDVERGKVSIDGHDVRTLTQHSLRRQIGLVTQETALFNRSARDNILYGRTDAPEEAVIAAARRAHAHDFIQALQDKNGRCGYDAYLGERGVKLSGGQRQRIALARAILKDAPILVLDEATSALDSEVEANIQAALSEIMQNKTVIAIAHRLSTLASMDRIIVLDQGEIIEEGTHHVLLARDGLYARYWHCQSGGFIQTEAAE